MKDNIDYLTCVNGNLRQKSRRLSSAVTAVKRIAETRTKGYDGITVAWNDGQYHRVSGLEFIQYAAQQTLAPDAVPAENVAQ